MSRAYPPDWLDIEAAAYATSLPVSTFRHYVNAGLLPEAVKIGKHALWSREEVSSALASLGAKGKTESIGDRLAGLANGQETKGRRNAA